MLKNRVLRLRFAPASVRIKVKNLPPTVTSKLLEFAFSVFGAMCDVSVFSIKSVDKSGSV